MSRGEIDKYPVSQLEARYGLARSAVYTRMKQLSIKPQRVGNKAYITGNELQWLDALHSFIKETGGSAAEFIEANGLAQSAGPIEAKGGGSQGLDFVSTGELGKLIRAFTEVMRRSQPAPDRMKRYADLEAAVAHQWKLSTADLAHLLDVSTAEIGQCGSYFEDAGFAFTRAGYRRDGQQAWRVTKPRPR